MIEQFEAHDGGDTDEALIGLVGSAFDEGRRGRAASDVLARGRQLRRRKRAVPALAALGLIAAASAGLSLAVNGPNAGHTLAADGTVVNVDEASFSVHTDAKTGIITVTVRQFLNEDELKQVLAEAGVRAQFDAHCPGPGVKVLNPFGVEDFNPTPGEPNRVASFTIDPSKMPSGSVLEFFYLKGPTPAYDKIGIGLYSAEATGACAPS